MAGTIEDWVGDELHDILGLSDSYIAEYFVGLAKKSSSVDGFVKQLENTGAITVTEEVREFSHKLWAKVPHEKVQEKPARAREREAKSQREKNKRYQLIMEESDEDEDLKHKRRKSSTSSRRGQ